MLKSELPYKKDELIKNKNIYEDKNPNIKFNSYLKYNNNNNLKNNIFEIYKSFQNNNFYIIIPNNSTNDLEVFSLNKDKLQKYKILKNHNYEIKSIKYYINNSNEEYLLSTDELEIIIIWDVTHNFIILKKIETNYEYKMYSSLLLFAQIDNYIITTSCPDITSNIINNSNTRSRIYSLTDGYLKSIIGTEMNYTYNIISWYNMIDRNYYIIEFCKGKIFIYNIIKNELYIEFFNIQQESNFYEGFIYSKNNNDYLLSGSDNGLIYIWNITNKTIFKIIDVNSQNTIKYQICHINKWNKKYFYIYEFTQNCIIFIDFEQLKKVSCFKFKNNNIIENIKIINYSDYGKSLIISNEENNIQIWN